jgi:7,8-dihydropterin-6-yl-methyl-4-(beta-D-ribofuranosyl)aminobenzene 5'-phosphate synthase
MRAHKLLLTLLLVPLIGEAQTQVARVHSLKITVLSTMLADGLDQTGEWGFSALVEADGHRILFDTGKHTDAVL